MHRFFWSVQPFITGFFLRGHKQSKLAINGFYIYMSVYYINGHFYLSACILLSITICKKECNTLSFKFPLLHAQEELSFFQNSYQTFCTTPFLLEFKSFADFVDISALAKSFSMLFFSFQKVNHFYTPVT